MSVIITSPNKSLTPSDNRVVFQIVSDTGAGLTIDATENNAMGLVLENVSGNLTNGVYNVVEPLEGEALEFVRLPNIGTELIEQIYQFANLPVPELPDRIDRYRPNGLTVTFASGTTATLEGELVSIDDSDVVWDVSIVFNNPVNWATWSGAGGDEAAIVPDFPLNSIRTAPGEAGVLTDTFIGLCTGIFPPDITDYTNDGTTVTWSNTGYTWNPAAGIAPQLKSLAVEMVLRPQIITPTFEDYTELVSLKVLTTGSFSPATLVQDCANLETLLFAGIGFPISLIGTGMDSLTEIFLPNAIVGDGIETGYFDGVGDLSALTIYTNVVQSTTNGGSPQASLAEVTAAGGTVVYNDAVIYPDSFAATPSGFTLLWEVDETSSTLDGKTGTIIEGISLDVANPLDDRPGFQYGDDAGLYSDATLGAGFNFILTGATGGSNFFGANSFRYEIDVYINGALNSTHQTFYTAGDVVSFDASGITRSQVGKPVVDSVIDWSARTSKTIYIKVRQYVAGVLVGDEEQSNTLTFWKSRLNELDFFNWEPIDWVPNAGENHKFLTNYPRDEQRLIGRTGNFYLSFFYPGTPATITDDIKFQRKRANTPEGTGASSTSTQELTNAFSQQINKTWNVFTVNLLSTDWGGQPIDTYDYMFANLYDEIEDQQLGERLSYAHFDGDCAHGATVHFMNKLGVMESFYFTRRKIEKAKVKGYGVEVNTGSFEPTENGEFDYLRRAIDSITLVTGWITEPVQNWLVEEVVESPYILIELGGFQFRAKVAESRWTKKTLINDNLFDQEIKFELAEIRYSPLV